VSDALQHPGLRNPAKYAQQTTRSNCIHCHNIHDAEHFHALQQGKWDPSLLWKYPLPDQLGMRIDRISGVKISDVVAGSPAAAAGLVPGEDILRVNGQAITSVADIQWALNDVPDHGALITVESSQSGLRQLRPAAGWRKSDFSWRGSMWNAPPRLQVWLPELTAEQSAKLGLPRGDSALEVRWINLEGPGGRQAQADGLREKDVVVALDGKPIRMDSRQFNAHLKLHYRVSDRLPLTILRDGRRMELSLLLVE
jgi:S1-C subfamily serine protease